MFHKMALTVSTGVLFGYLCELYSCQAVFLTCSLASSLSVSFCYFAPSLTFITFFFGVLHGGALSGISMSAITVSCQHFKRWQATACSLTIGAQAVNAFYAPQLVSYFIIEYGTLEAFLLLGVMTLNTLPAAIVLKSPPWIAEVRRSQLATGQPRELGVQILGAANKESSAAVSVHLFEMEPFCGRCSEVHKNELNAAVPQMLEPVAKNRIFAPTRSKFSIFKNRLSFIFTFKFLVDAFSISFQLYMVVTFIVVHVDLAKDTGLTAKRGIYLLHVYTVGDFALRAVGAFVIDREYVRMETLMALSFLGTTIACEALASSASFEALLLSSLVLGSSEGLVVSMPPILLLKDFKQSALPITMGATGFIAGVVLMTKPVLLGYFRDHFGKYDGVLHTLAAANGLLCTIWIFR
ncbi:unnamed protein product, partial [Ixodes hexagonus]